MSKRCPNCGFKESDDSTACHICGSALVDDNQPQDDFTYDFGAKPVESTDNYGNSSINLNVNVNNVNNNSFGGPGEVPMKIGPAKAMKLKKNLYSWSTSLIVICILRFVFSFLSLDDAQDISESLPLFEGMPVYGPLSGFVTVFYFTLVVLALFLVASIALMVFAQKVNKCQIPPIDNSLFENSKKVFIASIPTAVIVVVNLILEICSLAYIMQLNVLMNTEILSLAETVGSLVVDVLLVVGAIICLVSSLKLSKSKA